MAVSRTGAPFDGCPYKKSPTIWDLARAPDFWKLPNVRRGAPTAMSVDPFSLLRSGISTANVQRIRFGIPRQRVQKLEVNLESHVARSHRPLYPTVTHDSLNVALYPKMAPNSLKVAQHRESDHSTEVH